MVPRADIIAVDDSIDHRRADARVPPGRAFAASGLSRDARRSARHDPYPRSDVVDHDRRPKPATTARLDLGKVDLQRTVATHQHHARAALRAGVDGGARSSAQDADDAAAPCARGRRIWRHRRARLDRGPGRGSGRRDRRRARRRGRAADPHRSQARPDRRCAHADRGAREASRASSSSRRSSEEDIDTLGGLVFSIAGRIPARGELVRHPSGIEFEVLEADPRRIKKLRIHVPPSRRREAESDA